MFFVINNDQGCIHMKYRQPFKRWTAMYEIKIDKNKNRLYLTFGNIEDEAEMQEIVSEIRKESKKLKKGFTCLTDLRRYDPVEGIYEKYIREVQEHLLAAGMSKVARVRRPMGSIAHFQFDNVSYEVGYHAPNVTTLEEGEAILDQETS